MKSFVGYIIDKAVKAIPKKKKVSSDIKSVKPTKLPVSESIKKTKGDEYRKRYTALDKAEGKLKTGKQMMKEGQKERKKETLKRTNHVVIGNKISRLCRK